MIPTLVVLNIYSPLIPSLGLSDLSRKAPSVCGSPGSGGVSDCCRIGIRPNYEECRSSHLERVVNRLVSFYRHPNFPHTSSALPHQFHVVQSRATPITEATLDRA